MKGVGARIVQQLRMGLFAAAACLTAMFCLGGPFLGPADAYILPGPQILELTADEIGGLKTLRVEQRVTVTDSSVSAEPVTFNETLNYIFPDKFRSDSLHETTRRIHVVSRGEALTVVGDAIRTDGQAPYDQYKDLLLFNSSYLLQKILYQHHIDLGVTSLGRLDEQVVFVVGARYPDESVSQVWVDHERFVPLRWLNIQRSGGGEAEERWEFLYSHWQKVDGSLYPFKIETYHNQQLIRRIEVTTVDTKAVVDIGLFDIAQLRSAYAHTVAQPDGGNPAPADMEEVQRTIEDFKKKFEP
jgi:outer membrane lipoprotein-sorting protein